MPAHDPHVARHCIHVGRHKANSGPSCVVVVYLPCSAVSRVPCTSMHGTCSGRHMCNSVCPAELAV